jgi:hypothetical protein
VLAAVRYTHQTEFIACFDRMSSHISGRGIARVSQVPRHSQLTFTSCTGIVVPIKEMYFLVQSRGESIKVLSSYIVRLRAALSWARGSEPLDEFVRGIIQARGLGAGCT